MATFYDFYEKYLKNKDEPSFAMSLSPLRYMTYPIDSQELLKNIAVEMGADLQDIQGEISYIDNRVSLYQNKLVFGNVGIAFITIRCKNIVTQHILECNGDEFHLTCASHITYIDDGAMFTPNYMSDVVEYFCHHFRCVSGFHTANEKYLNNPDWKKDVMTTKVYIAYSIHGTNQFLVAKKEVGNDEYLALLRCGFEVVPSRRPNYRTVDGVKLHWRKLMKRDGTPHTAREWVLARFYTLRDMGWELIGLDNFLEFHYPNRKFTVK